MPKIDFNSLLSFVGKWVGTGACLYFGWQVGGWLDRFIPNLP